MIAIVGGGISGLAAAYELARRNVPFRLFEASATLGGLVQTHQIDGFTIEAGADSMLAQKRAGLELCDELGLGPRLISMKQPRTAFVLHRGRLHPLPSPGLLGIPTTWQGLARYSLLSPVARARLAMEPLIPVRSSLEDETVASFYRRRFGAETVDVLAQPLIGGIHAGDIERLSMRSVLPRLGEVERAGRRILPWARRHAGAGDPGGAFRSLADGMRELPDAIRRRLPEAAVRLNSPVISLTRASRGWVISPDEGDALACAAVILACPAAAAASLLQPIDRDAAVMCASVPYVSTVSIGMAWPRGAIAHRLEGSGFVVARSYNALRITACTWVSSKWEGRAPAGHVLLRAYIGGAHDPEAVDLDDAQLIALAAKDLSAILSIEGPPTLARVFRWRNAGAQHEVGHLDRIARLEHQLSRLPGLFVTGSGFRSVGIPDCIADGRAVAVSASRLAHAD